MKRSGQESPSKNLRDWQNELAEQRQRLIRENVFLSCSDTEKSHSLTASRSHTHEFKVPPLSKSLVRSLESRQQQIRDHSKPSSSKATDDSYHISFAIDTPTQSISQEIPRSHSAGMMASVKPKWEPVIPDPIKESTMNSSSSSLSTSVGSKSIRSQPTIVTSGLSTTKLISKDAMHSETKSRMYEGLTSDLISPLYSQQKSELYEKWKHIGRSWEELRKKQRELNERESELKISQHKFEHFASQLQNKVESLLKIQKEIRQQRRDLESMMSQKQKSTQKTSNQTDTGVGPSPTSLALFNHNYQMKQVETLDIGVQTEMTEELSSEGTGSKSKLLHNGRVVTDQQLLIIIEEFEYEQSVKNEEWKLKVGKLDEWRDTLETQARKLYEREKKLSEYEETIKHKQRQLEFHESNLSNILDSFDGPHRSPFGGNANGGATQTPKYF